MIKWRTLNEEHTPHSKKILEEQIMLLGLAVTRGSYTAQQDP